ncbi:MAG TPA: CDGSH iron-sulfur domain-containing protein [Candidatus Binatia bacterium]|nr:CDGSH iron-sulfur domain-containing protein [Candidatus Binatia bacterium]
MQVLKNGPYLVSGNVPLFPATIVCDQGEIPAEWRIGNRLQTAQTYSLCRCGQTKNKPFCDGTHVKVNFDGTETSDNEPFEKMAKEVDGPNLKLKDSEILCASARFCHRGGDIWQQIPISDNPELKQNAIRNSCDCPSGRLVIIDKATDKLIEPLLEKSIGLIEDPSKGVDGPYWIRSGIPIYSAGGKLYEARNRVTLCRCGKSTNKPFCDSSHYPEEDQEVIEDEQK